MAHPLRRVVAVALGLLLATGCDDFLMPGPDDADVPVAERVVSRLNRVEYDHTVRDLFGTTLRPAQSFPTDDFGYGFDNIAATLSMSPLHVEMYSQAAHELVAELYGERRVPTQTWRLEAETADATGGAPNLTGHVLFGEDAVSTRIYLPDHGRYTVAAVVASEGGSPATASLAVDGVELLLASVGPEQRLEASVELAAGHHTVEVAFLDAPGPTDEDEDLFVDVFEVSGPTGSFAPPPALAEQILDCVPGEPGPDGAPWTEVGCATHIVSSFGRRAWRRPLSSAELDEQLSVYGEARALQGSFDDGVRAALEALLVSPHFLFRIELDPLESDGTSTRVDGYVLASRLSYFLWSSMPDDRLLDLAAAGQLQDDDVLLAEVDRMLADPRAMALVDHLGGQWLGLRKVAEASPDPERFPEIEPALTRAMEAELRGLVASVFLDGAPLSALLASTEAELQPALAAFYGVPQGTAELPDRPGLLTRAGWLMSTSQPTRTSPVKRGAWVLDKILCDPPPPAPAGVPSLQEGGGASVVEQLAQHRADPACAACHDAMDPIGLGLESFDAIGRARTEYEDGQPVQVAGTLRGGGSFATTDELLQLLAHDPRVEACAVEQTFTYAMGRPPVASDQELLLDLRDALRETQSFGGLLRGIVASRPFRERTTQGGTP